MVSLFVNTAVIWWVSRWFIQLLDALFTACCEKVIAADVAASVKFNATSCKGLVYFHCCLDVLVFCILKYEIFRNVKYE